MKKPFNRETLICIGIFLLLLPVYAAAQGPQPGDIYREYSRTMGHTNEDWRVTDPNVQDERAHRFLPNPVLSINIDDLEDAIRAEALLDRWGGHNGTSNKKIRFNGHDWIDLPELQTTPDGVEPESFFYQDNPVINIPLEQLKKGQNTFEGTCDDPEKRWPQWGWDGIIIRIYYRDTKAHVTGKIVSPAAGSILQDNPEIQTAVQGDAERVDILAWYDGYDENGDGYFQDWHHHYWCIRGAESIDITGHAGTSTQAPYTVQWDTRWIPDQQPGGVKLMARIKGKNGIWYVSEPVAGLSLQREDFSVKMYKTMDLTPGFAVRNFRAKTCRINIDPADELANATDAVFMMRTWNGYAGHHEPFRINGWMHQFMGHNHNYDMDAIAIPVQVLRPGQNVISFYSITVHHGAEILWPGPAFLVRYSKNTQH